MTFRFGRLTLDSESRSLTRDGKPVPLSPKAFRLLQVSIEARLRAIPKAELHQRPWLRDGDEFRIGGVAMTLKIFSKPSATETATGH